MLALLACALAAVCCATLSLAWDADTMLRAGDELELRCAYAGVTSAGAADICQGNFWIAPNSDKNTFLSIDTIEVP